jgi:hypothetical protein
MPFFSPSPDDLGLITTSAKRWESKREYAEAIAELYGFIPAKIELKYGMMSSNGAAKKYGLDRSYITVEGRKDTAPKILTWVASGIHRVVDQSKFKNFKDMITDHERIRKNSIDEP